MLRREVFAMSLYKGCPGAITFREAEPEPIICPACGQETEIWSDEVVGRCHLCRAPLHRAQAMGPSCIDWCAYAKECIGAEKYERLKTRATEGVTA